MSTRKIFRPATGQKPARFIQALATNTDLYRGDFVIWDHEATPTAITWDGATLGANDFIFVNTDATAADKIGAGAGLIVGGDGTGGGLSNTNTTTAVCTATTGSLVQVQTWGVFDTHANTVDATVAAGALLLTTATVAGELVDATTATDDGTIMGVALSTASTYTRGTATDNTGVTCFVRCDW